MGGCTCLEVKGEDPNCRRHGVGTDFWAQGIVDSPIERSEAARKVRAHDQLVQATEMLLRLVHDMMPGVRHIALQDYQLLNEAPIKGELALAKAKEG
jgi:hypothetical protein